MSLSAGSMMARASSGSRSSISSIEPLMSANNTVTVLRSPSTASVASAVGMATGDFADPALLMPGIRGIVHWPQNLNTGGFSERHLGQMSASAAVHCPQNFIPSGFSKPHFEQRIAFTRSRARRMVQTKLVSVGFAKAKSSPPGRQRCQRFHERKLAVSFEDLGADASQRRG